MAGPGEEWRLPEKRRMIIQKLEEAYANCQANGGIQQIQQSPQELEQTVFDKSKTGGEYNHYLSQMMLKLARGSARRPGQIQQPGGQSTGNMIPQGGQMGMNPQAPNYNQSAQFQQFGGGMRPDIGMGMGQASQPPGYPVYRGGMAPRPNQPFNPQMRMPNQQVYQSPMLGGPGGYSGGMGGPPRYNIHPNMMSGGMSRQMPGMQQPRMNQGVPSNMGMGLSGAGMGGMSGPVQNPSSSGYIHNVQSISNPGYTGPTVTQSFSQAPPTGIVSSAPPPTSAPIVTSVATDQPGVKGQPSGPSGNPPTPHPPSMPGGVPSPAPPTPLLPASPATSNVGSPAPQPSITPEENEVYIRKLTELQKYIPLLQKWISKMTKDDRNNQLPKLKQLYSLLTNSNKRVPITTLMRCGEALDKMFSNDQRESHPSISSEATTPRATPSMVTPHSEPPSVPTSNLVEPRHSSSLMEFKIPHSPPSNYQSLLEAIHKRPLLPERLPPAKRMCNRDEPAIPYGLMRELATISNVKVKQIPNENRFDKSTVLHCTLDDQGLSPVPPLTIRIPSNYPLASPICDLTPYHTSISSTLITEVGRCLSDRLSRSVDTYSLSSLLSDWETCVLTAMSKQLANVDVSL